MSKQCFNRSYKFIQVFPTAAVILPKLYKPQKSPQKLSSNFVTMETWTQYLVQAAAMFVILFDAVYGQSQDDPPTWNDYF